MDEIELRQNDPGVSDQEALRHKDFGSVMNKVKEVKPPGGNNGGLLGWSIGMLGIVVMGAWIIMNQDSEVQGIEKIVSQYPIDRPFPDIPVEYQSFTINADSTSIITTNSGSKIHISPGCLVNSSGKKAMGPVEIQFREFRDMIDVFISGIPMTYDSAGHQYHFESAGMFEILGFQDGHPLTVAPQENLMVEFTSDYWGDQYNIYKFTEDSGWTYMYKDESHLHNSSTDSSSLVEAAPSKVRMEVRELEETIRMLEESTPAKPIRADKSNFNIAIDVLEEEFPEIALYENVKFEITDGESVDPALAELEWDNVTVTKPSPEEYLLHFERGKQIEEFLCRPVFDSLDFDAAMHLFEEQYTRAQVLIDSVKAKRAELYAKAKENKLSQEQSLRTFKLRQAYQSEAEASRVQITRWFRMQSFGIYNSDCPRNLPSGAEYAALLKDREEEDDSLLLDHSKVYLVEKDRNVMYTYFNVSNFSYNPASTNIMWTVTNENELAVFNDSLFAELSAGAGEKHIFEMEVMKIKITNEPELRELLNI